MESPNPFKTKKVDLLDIDNIFKFMIRGFPRLLLIISFYILVYFLYFIVKRSNKIQEVFQTYSNILLRLSGYKNINIDNQSKLNIKNSKAQIIVVNHASYIDIGVTNVLFPDAKFIASHYLKDLPIIGKHAKHNCIFLKSDFSGNLTDDVKALLEKGEKIVFFAEGCCNRPDTLLKLRRGAFLNGLSILPVHISYPEENVWINGEDNMVTHYLWQLCQKKNIVNVSVGGDYIPSDKEKKDVDLFINNFTDYYCDEFNVIKSDKSYKDHPAFFK